MNGRFLYSNVEEAIVKRQPAMFRRWEDDPDTVADIAAYAQQLARL